jgi:hypothetical protein
MSEMALHWSFEHLQPKSWAKEGPGVKLAIWLPATKSWESTRSRRALGECDMELESSWRGLQVWFRPRSDRRLGREAMMSQSPGSPKSGQFRDCTLGVPGQTTTWVWVRRSNAENTIGRMVMTPGGWWWHFPSPGRGVSCESELARGLSQHRIHAERVLTNLCWFWMQVRDQIAWSLPSLIPGLLARPSTPFNAGSRERPPSPNFPQLYIVEPSSGFNKGLMSASLKLFWFCEDVYGCTRQEGEMGVLQAFVLHFLPCHALQSQIRCVHS